MNRCSNVGCAETCRACELGAEFAAAKVASAADNYGDSIILGHIMAVASLMQGRGPAGRLHLCEAHLRFAVSAAKTCNPSLPRRASW